MQTPETLDRPVPPPTWVAWLETGLLSAAMVLLGLWVHPGDPFFVREGFPWAILAPLLAGLRYGFAHGLGSAVLLLCGLVPVWRLQLVPMPSFPAEAAVGLLSVGMLAGEFADLWRRRFERLSALCDYQGGRLSAFTRGYHLLKVSHDALEQRVAGTTQNLREALTTLRHELLEGRGDPVQPLAHHGPRILQLFASYGWVQVAALLPVRDGQAVEAAAGELGQPGPVSASDPLLVEALRRGQLASVEATSGAAEAGSQLLAAIPIVDVKQRTWAVVAVREMLFVAFQGDNLKLLAVLAGHIGDILASAACVAKGHEPGSEAFEHRLHRALLDLKDHGVPACLVSFRFEDSQQAQAHADFVLHHRRGLDQVLRLRDGQGRPVLLVLLNLTDAGGLQGYLRRLDLGLSQQFGLSASALHIHAQGQPLERGHSAPDLLSALVEQLGAKPPSNGTEA